MDRRTFNKSLGAIFGAIVLPKVPALAAGSSPVVPFAGHYGLSHFSATTTYNYNLQQVFSSGLQEYPEIEEPFVDIDISFFVDKERRTERTVYFTGKNAKWTQEKTSKLPPTDNDLGGITHDSTRTQEQVSPISGESKKVEKTYRIYYSLTDFAVFKPGTSEKLRLDHLAVDDMCDIEISIWDGGKVYDLSKMPVENNVYRLLLKDFKVSDMYDFQDSIKYYTELS